MYFDLITPIAAGANNALILDSLKRADDSVRAGGNEYLTASTQFGQLVRAISFSDLALESAGLLITPSVVRYAMYLTPPLLAYFSKQGIENETARNIVNFIQNHIGNICQIAALVSSVALIYFGSVALGVSSLVFMAFGALQRSSLLPSRVRSITLQCSPALIIATSFFSDAWDVKLIAVLNFALYCSQIYFSRRNKQTAHLRNDVPQNTLTMDQLKEFLDGTVDYELNRKYIHDTCIPEFPNEDSRDIYKASKSIWRDNIQALRTKLKYDQRHIKYHGHPDTKSDDELIAFADKSLKGFINNTIEKNIRNGSPIDYAKVQNYLRVISHHLKTEQDPINRADILLRLAIEGGEYCGPGAFEAAESVCYSIITKAASIPFRTKVLAVLQDLRLTTWQDFYESIKKTMPEKFSNMVDFHDVHTYNQLLNLYGNEFGLRTAGAENDSLAIIDPLEMLFMSYLVGNQVRQALWYCHPKEALTRQILKTSGSHQLPKDGISDWLKKWMERQPEGNKLIEGFSVDGTIAGKRIFNSDGSFRLGVINAMLYDMAIFKHKEPKEEKAPESFYSRMKTRLMWA